MGQMTTPIDVSYLADTIILFRYYEDCGRLLKALSVLKKRSGRHEDTIRSLELGVHGIHIGEPLVSLRGVLIGVPTSVLDGPPGDDARGRA
jgi:circadian clock protein KaiC